MSLSSPIAFTAQLGKRDLYWYVLYQVLRTWKIKLGVMIFAIFLYFFLEHRDTDEETALVLSLGIIGAAIISVGAFCVFELLSLTVYFFAMKKRFRDKLFQNYEYSFSEDSYNYVGAEGSGTINYSNIKHIYFHKRHFIFEFVPAAFLLVPWRVVPQSDRAALEQHLRYVKKKVLA